MPPLCRPVPGLWVQKRTRPTPAPGKSHQSALAVLGAQDRTGVTLGRDTRGASAPAWRDRCRSQKRLPEGHWELVREGGYPHRGDSKCKGLEACLSRRTGGQSDWRGVIGGTGPVGDRSLEFAICSWPPFRSAGCLYVLKHTQSLSIPTPHTDTPPPSHSLTLQIHMSPLSVSTDTCTHQSPLLVLTLSLCRETHPQVPCSFSLFSFPLLS